jgi:hypothetical protein
MAQTAHLKRMLRTTAVALRLKAQAPTLGRREVQSEPELAAQLRPSARSWFNVDGHRHVTTAGWRHFAAVCPCVGRTLRPLH